jgi:hypothetical protein
MQDNSRQLPCTIGEKMSANWITSKERQENVKQGNSGHLTAK